MADDIKLLKRINRFEQKVEVLEKELENQVVRGREGIAEIIKVSPKDIPGLHEKYDLPVWQLDGKGPWRSTKKSLVEWASIMATGQGGANMTFHLTDA